MSEPKSLGDGRLPWIMDLELMRKHSTHKRSTSEELNTLKGLLNHNGMVIVSDAIGSLQFDLIEEQNRKR